MNKSFFIPMVPPTVTAQEHKIGIRNGKPFIYEPAELRQARSKLVAHLGRFAPSEPFTGALRLMVKWCFPSNDKHRNGEYRTTRPDTDNLNKLLKDCMTKVGFFKDDALVASEIIEKFWADKPGIYISLETLEDADAG